MKEENKTNMSNFATKCVVCFYAIKVGYILSLCWFIKSDPNL